MQYCWLPQDQIIRRRAPTTPPPIIISQQRYARIAANANRTAQQQQREVREQRRCHSEQLRAGGEALLLEFAGRKLCSTQAERITELRLAEAEQLAERRQQPQDTSANDRSEELQRRRQRIAAAERLVEQLRPGPRELQCAQLQSEVLGAVNVQRQLQSDFALAAQQQRELDRKVYGEQVLLGLEAAQQAQAERRQRLGEYKLELQQAITERRQQRSQEHEAEQKKERAAMQRHEKEVQSQLTLERAAQSRRRRERRDNAQAALEMAKEREQRLSMLEELEQQQCEVHNAAKEQLETLKLTQSQQRVRQRLRRNAELALQQKPRLHYSAGEDEARHERQLKEMRQACSAEQRRQRQRREAAIEARLEAQQQAEAAARATAQQKAEKRSQQVALRLQNEKLRSDFKRSERQQQLQAAQLLRSQLDKQLKERAEEEAKPEVDYNRQAQLENLRQDEFFFDYARQLMGEAKAKGCPLKPFVRAVAQYKEENRIAAEVRVPRHLICKLPWGLRAPGDSQAVAKKKEDQKTKEPTEEQRHMKRILDNLQKIEALVLDEAKTTAETTK